MVEKIVGSNFPANNGYGQNGYAGASSETKIGSVSAGFKATPDDPVREEVARLGTNHHDAGSQVRQISDTPLAPTFGHKGAAPGPKIPKCTGFVDGVPVRKPS